jgi:hypothetical protein
VAQRRGSGSCFRPVGDGVVAPSFWLERFDDWEIAEMALFMFGHRPDPAHIRSERERLLGRVRVVAA